MMEDYIANRIAAARLGDIFKDTRIADIIRRPAKAFEGRAAIDLIKEGRIEEVRRIYDEGLTYMS